MDGYVIPTENGTAFLDRAIEATEGPNPRGTDSTGETGAASSFDTINNQLQQFNYDPAQTTSYQEALDNTLSADSPVLEQTAYLAGSDASARGFGRTSVGTDVATRAMLGEANKMASADILAQQFNVGERNKGYQDMFSAQSNTYGNWQQDQESARRAQMEINASEERAQMDIAGSKERTKMDIAGSKERTKMDIAGSKERAQMEIDATVKADLLAGQVELANTRKKMEADILMNEDLTPAVKDAYVRNTYNGFFDDIDSLYASATGEVNVSDTLYNRVKSVYETETNWIDVDGDTPMDERVARVGELDYTKEQLTMPSIEGTKQLVSLVRTVGTEPIIGKSSYVVGAGIDLGGSLGKIDAGTDITGTLDRAIHSKFFSDKEELVTKFNIDVQEDRDNALVGLYITMRGNG